MKHLLLDYVRSPSLKHSRDPHAITKLARDIVENLDRGNPIWGKWTEHRELVVKEAAGCWVPNADLRTFRNGMLGPTVTETDVNQRLKVTARRDVIDPDSDDVRLMAWPRNDVRRL